MSRFLRSEALFGLVAASRTSCAVVRAVGGVVVSHVPGTGCAGNVRNDPSAYLRRSTYIIGESNSVADLTSSLDSGGFLWLIWLLL